MRNSVAHFGLFPNVRISYDFAHVKVSNCICQGKIEMSPSEQSRNVPLRPAWPEVRVRVEKSARGRAQADAQGRGDDGAGSEESIGNEPSGGDDEVAIRGFCF